MTRLRLNGFGLAIDDFGKGFSGFEQLSIIPFTGLKIDRSFVSGASQVSRIGVMAPVFLEFSVIKLTSHRKRSRRAILARNAYLGVRHILLTLSATQFCIDNCLRCATCVGKNVRSHSTDYVS